MYRNDSGYTKAALPFGQFLGLAIKITVRFQIFAKFLRIHRVRGLVNIDESDLRTSLRNGFSSSDKRVRHSHDDVAFTNARGHERKAQRIRAAVYAHAVFGIAESGKLALKIF